MRRIVLLPGRALALLTLLPGLAARAESPRDVLPVDPRPTAYQLTLTPHEDAMTFGGQVAIELDVATATRALTLDAVELTFERADVDGEAVRAITPLTAAHRVRFDLARPMSRGHHTLRIDYHGRIRTSPSGLFITRYATPPGERRYLLTQLEPGDARGLFPGWDEPGAKATFTVSVVIPAADDAVSNMPVARTTKAKDGATKTVTFAPTPRMSSYLLFVGVGQFERIETRHRRTRVSILASPTNASRGRYALDVTPKILDYYADYFGAPYALPKLDLVAAPLPNAFGAMENWGAILFAEPWILTDPKLSSLSDMQTAYDTVAHELAHQWFGNLVTMAWWDDLWLNEGFASWMATKATARLQPRWEPWLAFLIDVDGTMSRDARASTHPIVQPIASVEEAEQAFDQITYTKGQAVIRMIEAYVGEDAFRAGVRRYIRAHAHGNAVTRDLWSALEAASKTPVTGIAADFTEQSGVPLVEVTAVRCERGASIVSLRQERHAEDPSAPPLAWRVPVVLGVVGHPSSKVLLQGEVDLTTPGCGAVKVNIGQTGYYRVLYADALAAPLRAAFPRLGVADQLGLLSDARALGETGHGPIEAHLALAAALPVTADALVWMQVTRAMQRLTDLHRGLATEAAFGEYARRLLQPVLARIGPAPRRGDAPTATVLREALVEALGELGDQAVIAEAQRRFAASATDDAALPSELRTVLLDVVGRSADAATWDALRARAHAASTPLERDGYWAALASARDPALAKRTLALLSTDEVPAQRVTDLLSVVAERHPALAWRHYVAHRDALDSGLDPLQRQGYAPSLVARSADPKLSRALDEHAAAHMPAALRGEVAKALETIAKDVQLREAALPALDAWIAAQAR